MTLFKQLFGASLLALSLGAQATDIIKVQHSDEPQYLTLDALIEPVRAATVSAQTSGRIIKIHYDVNDMVPAGAALLEITSKEQSASLTAAEADYAKALAVNAEAQATLKRYQELFPKGAISRGAFDEAVARAKSSEQAVSAANAAIVRARESLGYTTVFAPFAGVLTERHVEQGETVSPGQPLLSGFDTEKMRAVMQVPGRYLDALKASGKVSLALAGGRAIESDKLTIFSFASPQSHSFQVRIDLPDGMDVQPGTWAKVSFVQGTRPMLLLPQSAIIKRGELTAVYLMHGDKPVLTQVRLGKQQGERVQVLSGLNDGDMVAADGYSVKLQ
ncbi:efflux RND transporter periplasmic adaptor subunit [Shewanella sp. JM162201]|uniref:Efflux RND transporter periplasmic adaptor subunit n=1 Tax=Shewanella jiangmenensis TaxID=2837387 RepID=A0ABS5V798_9GAMM|nr:efflux RND transporter periplasmic adaptor subunit [Shewanella jiangmenensis]MBT1446309.1 efflux RND transporter periplasmic adaptor subunit [Shewanella jiangmenensis]